MTFIRAMLGLCLSAPRASSRRPGFDAAKKGLRAGVLPDSVIPVHYELALSPDAEALTFHAEVAITVEVRIKTAAITLNAVGLSFDRAAVDGDKEGMVRSDEKLGRATITVVLACARTTSAVDQYHGKIGRSTLASSPWITPASTDRGARSRLISSGRGTPVLPAGTNLRARRRYAVGVAARPHGNLQHAGGGVTSLSASLQRVRFAQTPKMSTYLLFFGVGDFERIHSMVDDVDVGVIVKRGDAQGLIRLEQPAKSCITTMATSALRSHCRSST